MQSSDIPAKIQLPWATSGSKVVIPVPSQIPLVDGRASFTTGFPPLNATPLDAGGVAPFWTDFNGILFQMTAVQQWQCAGGFFKYDNTFATAVGGYPKYAVLQGASGTLYQNTVENNLTNPESSGVGWVPFLGSATTTPQGSSQAPTGIIEQWGTFTTSSSGYTALTFPKPFPNALLSITGNQNTGALAGAFINFNMAAKTTTSVPCAAVNGTVSGYLAYNINFRAIGY